METKVKMWVTSADLLEMYKEAIKIEQTVQPGGNLEVREWNCGNFGGHFVTVKVVVDQERAQRKGLMK